MMNITFNLESFSNLLQSRSEMVNLQPVDQMCGNLSLDSNSRQSNNLQVFIQETKGRII